MKLRDLTADEVVGVARAVVHERHPYYDHTSMRLRFFPTRKVESMAVTQGLVVFYNPDLVLELGPEGTAPLVAHEPMHVILDHEGRWQRIAPFVMPRYRAPGIAGLIREFYGARDVGEFRNYAADFEINVTMRGAAWKWPEKFTPLHPEPFGLPKGLRFEEYVDVMLARAEQEQRLREEIEQSAEDGGDQDGMGHDDDQGDRPGEAGDGGTAEGGGPDVKTNPAGAGALNSTADGAGAGAGPDDDGVGNLPVSGAEQAAPAAPGHGRCGGCAGTPHAVEIEAGPEVPRGASATEVDVARRMTMEEVRNYRGGTGRGVAPGDFLLKFATDYLEPPKVDARAVLARAVRGAVSAARGNHDWKYGPVSNRRAVMVQWMGEDAPLLPVLRGPDPIVVGVLDTSGSMGSGKRSRVMRGASELVGFAKAASQPVWALAVDARVQALTRLRTVADVERLMSGGGGTDMRVGIAAACERKLGADVVVLVTDGETEWPEPGDVPSRVRVVVIVVNERESVLEDMPPFLRRYAVFFSMKEERSWAA